MIQNILHYIFEENEVVVNVMIYSSMKNNGKNNNTRNKKNYVVK